MFIFHWISARTHINAVSKRRTPLVVCLLCRLHSSSDARFSVLLYLVLQALELAFADLDLVAEVRDVRNRASAPGKHRRLLLAGVQHLIVVPLELAGAELRLIAEIRDLVVGLRPVHVHRGLFLAEAVHHLVGLQETASS